MNLLFQLFHRNRSAAFHVQEKMKESCKKCEIFFICFFSGIFFGLYIYSFCYYGGILVERRFKGRCECGGKRKGKRCMWRGKNVVNVVKRIVETPLLKKRSEYPLMPRKTKET